MRSDNGAQGASRSRTLQLVDERHFAVAYNLAYLMMVGCTHDAEKAVLEAVARAARERPRTMDPADDGTRLYQLVIDACLRRKPRQSVGAIGRDWGDHADVSESGSDHEQSLPDVGHGESIDRCLGRLDPRVRAAVIVRDVLGLQTAEAAGVLEIPVRTLKERLHQGRVILMDHLTMGREITGRALGGKTSQVAGSI